MRRLLFFSENSSGGTNTPMTLTAVRLGGSEQIGFLLFGGVPSPNSVYINRQQYKIKQLLTNFNLNSSSGISVLTFEGNVLTFNSVQLEINGTVHTFTNNGKAYGNNDDIFTEGETYTINFLSAT